jgi:cytochrome c556
LIRLIAGAALTMLAACGGSDATGGGNDSLAEANASGNAASAAVENSFQQSAATPLQKEQALALMEERHKGYEKIGGAMRTVSKQLKGEQPDVAQVRTGAAAIAELAPKVTGWFPAGTGPDVGKTEARAEIWTKPEDFAAKAQGFQRAAMSFNTAAQGSDLEAMRSAHANLGKSCKECHDLYREEE